MGILNDIARRDLNGNVSRERILRPELKIELMRLIVDEIDRQGKDVDLRHVIIPENMVSISQIFADFDIESVNLTGWDVSHIKKFNAVFSGCDMLKEIKGIENWDVSEGDEFMGMFEGCESLEEIDLSGWKLDYSKGIWLNGMFNGCKRLKKIKGMENWNLPETFLKTMTAGSGIII